MRYPLRFEIDSDGTTLVTCPDLPEVTTSGVDEAEAALRGADAVATAIMGRIADRQDVPAPSDGAAPCAVLNARDGLKVGLYKAMRTRGVDRTELAGRLGCRPADVDRLLDLERASEVVALEAAIHAVESDSRMGMG